MNFYSFHIGDYAVHTRHLSLLEDLAYRRLLDLYYTRERAFPADFAEVARLIGMRDYQTEVAAVLAEFFKLDESGWTHARCDAEIAHMQDKQAKAKASAQASVNARSTNAQRPLSNRLATNTNTKTITNTKETPKAPKGADGRFEGFWQAYPKKVGKDAALKAFEKRKPDDVLLQRMLNAINAQSRGEAWLKDGGQFIPNPATWLNQGRWQDESPTTGPPQPARGQADFERTRELLRSQELTQQEREASDRARRLVMEARKGLMA